MKAFSTTSEGWFVKHMDICNVLFVQNKEFSLRIIFKIKWEIMKDAGIPYSLEVCIHLRFYERLTSIQEQIFSLRAKIFSGFPLVSSYLWGSFLKVKCCNAERGNLYIYTHTKNNMYAQFLSDGHAF